MFMTVEQLKEIAAKTAHEANRAFCEAMGDKTQKPWDEAPAWQKWSARDGVGVVFDALIVTGEPPTPAKTHEGWLARKVAEGWVYGPEKNEAKKEHPCMVPFSRLSAEQQVKDHLFVAVVTAIWRGFKG